MYDRITYRTLLGTDCFMGRHCNDLWRKCPELEVWVQLFVIKEPITFGPKNCPTFLAKKLQKC
jgi:hypothetical protein